MKSIWICMLCLVVGLVGCSKSDSGPSSAEGSWTYTTADKKLTVTFELVKNSSGSLTIQNQTYKLDGTVYESAATITGVALPTIGGITINANDAKLTYAYFINFHNSKVSSDFKRMDVADGQYTSPAGTVNFTAISITRP